jgi:ABC-type multidrug transport system fused ATPase/permease subunit
VPLVPLYRWLQHYYRLTSRELKRIGSVAMSPVYNHFNETLQGLTTIKALGASKRYQFYKIASRLFNVSAAKNKKTLACNS